MSVYCNHSIPAPALSALHPWELYSASLGIEYRQSLEEGLDVEPYADLFRAVEALPADRIDVKEKLADTLFELVMAAPTRPGYPYDEPSDPASIRARFNERNGHDWCHTVSNAMIVAASLLYGGGTTADPSAWR